MKVDDLLNQYRKSINPPYTKKDAIQVFVTVLTLLLFALTVISTNQIREPSSRAARQKTLPATLLINHSGNPNVTEPMIPGFAEYITGCGYKPGVNIHLKGEILLKENPWVKLPFDNLPIGQKIYHEFDIGPADSNGCVPAVGFDPWGEGIHYFQAYQAYQVRNRIVTTLMAQNSAEVFVHNRGEVYWSEDYTCMFYYPPPKGINPVAPGSSPYKCPDSDNDGFADYTENFWGTDPNKACATTPTPDDEAVDAWPRDYNDDQVSNDFDKKFFLPYAGAVKSNFDGKYNPRFDASLDGHIDLVDGYDGQVSDPNISIISSSADPGTKTCAPTS